MDNSNFCMTNAEANPTKSSLQTVTLMPKWNEYETALQNQLALKPFTISADLRLQKLNPWESKLNC